MDGGRHLSLLVYRAGQPVSSPHRPLGHDPATRSKPSAESPPQNQESTRIPQATPTKHIKGPDPLNLPLIAHHITRSQDPGRLCDGRPAADADIPTGDVGPLREARAQATLCPTCQLKSGYPPFHLRQSRYRAGHRTLAHLYTVPVLNDLDDIRNCPHCRQSPGDHTCRAWQEAWKGVRNLRQEARRVAREVTELRAATIYQFLDGSVGYFSPDAPMWQEAGDLTGQDLDKALEILQQRGLPGGKSG